MTPDLRQLRTFVAIAEAGSIGAAAAAMRAAQSALTRQLQALEHACRSPLFQRTARGVVLTEAGRLLLPRARLLLAGLDEALAEVSELNREPGGRVRIAAPPSLADILYPPLATRVLERLPRVRLELREELTEAALAGLRKGALDLAVVSVPEPDDPRIACEPLFHERMMLVGRPGDAALEQGARKAHGGGPGTIALARLTELPLILPVGAGWLRLVRRRLGRGGARDAAPALQARIQMESHGPMKALVRAGLGYAVLPYSAVQPELDGGALSGAAIEGFLIPRLLALPQARPPGRAAQAVAAVLRAEATSMLAAGRFGWLAPDRPARRR